jgi:hypothetical protein
MNSPTEQTNPDKPTIENQKVPAWIKVMWFLGVSWIIGYIFAGLKSTMTTW